MNSVKIRILFILAGIPLLAIGGCSRIDSRLEKNDEPIKKDSIVTFVDIKDYSREEISKVINLVTALEAKVVAIDLVFSDWRGTHEDSLLVRSIFNSTIIALGAGVDNAQSNFIKSHQYFANAATGEGVISFVKDSDEVYREYVPLVQMSTNEMLSFFNLVAYNYKPDLRDKFFKLQANKAESIICELDSANFEILDPDQLTITDVKGKIVILTDVANSTQITVLDKNGAEKTVPSFVVMANIILSIIHGSN